MRALDRLALYSTCTATAVIIASTALIFHQLPPRVRFSEPRIREQPIVPTVDLSRLTPDIRQAIEQARSRGLEHARADLGSLRAEMMSKV